MSPSSNLNTVSSETLESRETSEERLKEKFRKLKVKVLKETVNKRKREIRERKRELTLMQQVLKGKVVGQAQSPAVSVSMRPRFSPPSRLGAQVWLHVRDIITSLIITQTIHTSFA